MLIKTLNKTAKSPKEKFKLNFAQALRGVLPKHAVLSDKEQMRVYECDGLSAYRVMPWLVAIPETVEQIQEVLQLCHENSVAVIARGAGTGLSGGALPKNGALLLSLVKFNEIIEIDPLNRTAKLQPGVRNLAISEAAKPHGLYYAPDPSSQIACTIGGNVAENSGGVHCLKYGLTVHNVLQVKILTIEGEMVTLGSNTLTTHGFDFLALINGSEGMLGIIIEITVKLLPIPETTQVLLAAFDKVEDAAEAVANIIADGVTPAGLEMMDKLAISAAEDFVHAGYPTQAEAILLCELDGTQHEVELQVAQVKILLEKHNAHSLRIATSTEEKNKIWQGRKAAFPAVGRLAPDYYCMDGTIPRKQLPYVLSKINELSKSYDLAVANVFHAGDGNLHPLILFDANKPGELERTEEFGGKILELCVEVGGTITGEHGVGIEKINQMCAQFDAATLQQFHELKAAFDPNGLLNPGKAIPTLQRCAEFGAMHVHHNQLPHPDLERF